MRFIRRPINENNEKPASNTCNRTAKTNNSLVTKSMLMFTNLHSTYTSLVFVYIQFWQYTWTYLRWVDCEIEQTFQVEQAKLVTWQSQQTTVGLCQVSGWQMKLLAIETAWLGWGRTERCAVSRNQHMLMCACILIMLVCHHYALWTQLDPCFRQAKSYLTAIHLLLKWWRCI